MTVVLFLDFISAARLVPAPQPPEFGTVDWELRMAVDDDGFLRTQGGVALGQTLSLDGHDHQLVTFDDRVSLTLLQERPGIGDNVTVGDAAVTADDLDHGPIVLQFTDNGGHFELGCRVIRPN